MKKNSILNNTDLTFEAASGIIGDALSGFNDGELFIEHTEAESINLDDGQIKSTNFNVRQGFGLRGVREEKTFYAHSSDISRGSLFKAISSINSGGHQISHDVGINTTPPTPRENTDSSFESQVKLMGDIDLYLRKKDQRVKQVTVSLRKSTQIINIIKSNGAFFSDLRPLSVLAIIVLVEQNGRTEMGRSVLGLNDGYSQIMEEKTWKSQADEALRKAILNLEAIPAPAGEMPVILGPGIPAVLLHEAVGHGLEADFNRKGTSNFSEMLGKRIASPGVTVMDAGNIMDMEHAHGNLGIDDEGSPTKSNVLIEDGIMVGHMSDNLNSRLMGKPSSSGNCRRQGYNHIPIPRMTNTYMLGGNHTQEEMIKSVKRGILALDFGGGQVDITSGKFVFSMSEAYLIEDGQIKAPVKGATLVGNGPDVMQNISMIGDDLKLDHGVGMCGKAGQSVIVGLGQPSLKIDRITVGGTA